MKLTKSMSLIALLATGILLAACRSEQKVKPSAGASSAPSVVSASPAKSSTKSSSAKKLQAVSKSSEEQSTESLTALEAETETEEEVVPSLDGLPPLETASESVPSVGEEHLPETTWSEAAEVAPSDEAVAVTSYSTAFDGNALSAGDYSSIAGTWANSKGQVFTVMADGTLYFGQQFDGVNRYLIEGVGVGESSRIGGSLGFYAGDERQGGAHISIVPAGVANINGLVGEVDHIEIGHDISSGYEENQYYRQ